ncbi:hypothetical protein PBAC_29220 [Pedobacter glucosidilyticus]|nr:hypothetical protein [Pedobacter glucosidilyticus]KHJ36886.1 hypothetical protein PBAC_29220 [Pedobacter glucosidilyticus]
MNQLAEITQTEVFSTNFGSISHCPRTDLLTLTFSGKTITYKYPCLQRLNKVIHQVDLAKMTDASHSGLEIVFLCGAEDCFVLDIHEILGLKDLLHGTFTMFNLNSAIKDCLQRVI